MEPPKSNPTDTVLTIDTPERVEAPAQSSMCNGRLFEDWTQGPVSVNVAFDIAATIGGFFAQYPYNYVLWIGGSIKILCDGGTFFRIRYLKLHSDIETLVTKTANLEENGEKTVEHLKETEEGLAKVEDDIEKKRDQAQEINTKASVGIGQKTAELSKVVVQFENLTKDIASIKALSAQLKNSAEQLIQVVASTHKLNQDLRVNELAVKANIEKVETASSKLEKKADEFKKALDEENEKINNALNEILKKTIQLEELHQKVEKQCQLLYKNVAALDTENQVLQTNLKQMEEDLKNLAEEKKRTEEETAKLQKLVDQNLPEQIEILKKLLAEK